MNTFGRIFKVNLFGESHGKFIGTTIDGCPAGLAIHQDDFNDLIQARKAGAFGTTSRTEDDTPQVISGVYNGKTTGAPITILFENNNYDSRPYLEQEDFVPRPSHSDFVAYKKFNASNDPRGSGHFSGRLTLALVAAAVIAMKIVKCNIISKIISIGGKSCYSEILQIAKEQGDSLGGIIETVITDVPIGLGEPFFDSIESVISHLAFSIPGVKGIEFGAGFESAMMNGTQYNDAFISTEGKTSTNNAGGINAGISNGNDIVFRTAIRPTASISTTQRTLNFTKNEMTELKISGRHDACFALRVPPIMTSIAAIALADLFLINLICKTINNSI